MTKSFRFGLALLFLVPGLLFTTSCAKKIKSDTGVTMTDEGSQMQGSMADEELARQKALEAQRLQEERLRDEAKNIRATTEREAFENENIFFEFDKSQLLPEAKDILKNKARWLLANPGASVIIEGHCDERGTSEYNVALGDRRARAAKNYLIDLGIGSMRMTTISYGEEKPVAFGHDEASWSQNRRAHFIIQ